MVIIINKEKEVWDDIWGNTPETITYKDIFYLMDDIKLEYLLDILPSPQENIKVIEVGCGSARLSCFLASLGYNTTCLDYSENALTVAKKNYYLTNNHGKFIVGDVRDMPLENDTYDVVLSTGLLEHFNDPKIVINEMVRILKPGGIFYSDIVPDKFSLFRSHLLFLKKLNLWTDDGLYEIKTNKKDITSMLQSADLREINVFPAGVFLPQLPYGRRFPLLKKLEYNTFNKIKSLIKYCDNTAIAKLLGFYYFVYAKKAK